MLLITVAQFVGHELLLFAAIGLLLCGVDDIIIDVAWLIRGLWRHLVIRRRYPAATVETLAKGTAGRLAVFVPAWDESGIIATMVGNALNSIKDPNYRIYVGLYANDPASQSAMAAITDPRVRIAINHRPGPTTKADCLNVLWEALCRDDADEGQRTAAVILHDAEDAIDPDELTVHRALIDRFEMV